MSFFSVVVASTLCWAAAARAVQMGSRALQTHALAHAAVGAIAAYVAVILLGRSFPAWLAVSCGVVLAVVAGGSLNLLFLRTSKSNYPVVTFALQVAFSAGVLLAPQWTGGPNGLAIGEAGRAVPSWLTVVLSSVLFTAIQAGLGWFERTPLGVAAFIVGESREFAASLGLKPMQALVSTGAVQGASLGLAMITLAVVIQYIEPSSTGIEATIVMVAIASLATGGSFGRILLAAFILVALPQLFRLVGFSSLQAGYLRVALSGVALLARGAFLAKPKRIGTTG